MASENEEIRYVNAELVQVDDSQEYNVRYANNGPTVYVRQGQYVIPVSGHAVVFQDDQGEYEYIVNNMDEEVQEGNETEQVGQSVIYYAGEFADHSQMFEEDVAELSENVSEETGMDEAIPSPKQIKLEQNYIDEYDESQSYDFESNFAQVQEEAGANNVVTSANSEQEDLQQSQYQFAILKNGKLHLQTLNYMDTCNELKVEDKGQQLQEQLAAFQRSINMDDASLSTSTVDLDKITGKNLITGQTVTLDSYFDKLQRRLGSVDVTEQRFPRTAKAEPRPNSDKGLLKSNVVNNSNADENCINKKIVVGKTAKGKKIVGKILSVRLTAGSSSTEQAALDGHLNRSHKETSVINKEATTSKQINVPEAAIVEKSGNEAPNDPVEPQLLQPHIIIKKHLVSRENFDHNVGKTLSGLMELESVRDKIKNKNLVVKLVEKTYDRKLNAFKRTVSYVYGHMELINLYKDDVNSEQWAFVLHNEKSSSPTSCDGKDSFALVEEEEDVNLEESTENKCRNTDDKETDDVEDISLEMDEDVSTKQHNETISVTINVTIDKCGKKVIKVSMNPQESNNRCSICCKEFKTSLQMRQHLNNVHMCDKTSKCELCGKTFANETVLLRHQKIHTSERWYQCLKCSKAFNTAGSLKRHLTVHNPSLRPLECSLCKQRFTDESSLRKHLLIHTGIRAYTCEICSRAFVNQGDLNFHRRIHDPVKQFSCDVCGREFSRHSNLMRHAEIHRGASALHRCDICGCSYSFVSSLTRHIVQKHISQQQQ